ncbi:MAG: SdpI family protein [Thermomicrobiales bacterium]|nr:SdpI family protein [Thermomicrobiales bacterium]
METLRRYRLTWMLLAATLLAPVLVYDRLPDSVPTHWNARGEIDAWMPKSIGAFAIPLTSAFVSILCVLAPALSPKGFEMNRMERVYPTMVAAIAAAMLYVTILMLRAALGTLVAMHHHAVGIAGLVFVVVGNYLGKSTRNFFFGIRTRWTLTSDEVWERTHRFAGPVFVVAGFVLLGSAIMEAVHLLVVLGVIAVTIIAPVVQSFLFWRRTDARR